MLNAPTTDGGGREEGGGAAARRLADFVGVLDKFSAIGSFDADSPSASPPTCVQIEGFRKSCDIPPRRRGKDREKMRGTRSRQIGEPEGKREIPKRWKGERRRRRRVEWGGTRTSLCVSRGGTVRLLRGNLSELAMFTATRNQAVSSLNVDEPTCLLTS